MKEMAPGLDIAVSYPETDPSVETVQVNGKNNVFSLHDGNISISGITILSDVPDNIFFSSFSSVHKASNAPAPLLHQVQSKSCNGGFIGFAQPEPSSRLLNSLGKLRDRRFVSIFRYKTWWSTMWVGNSGSDLQMETQWVLLDVPELRSYVLILPLIEGKFRSALRPGNEDQIIIDVESGSTQVKSSTFDAIAYVHISDDPYNLMREAYSAARVHLNTFRMLEEKSVPPLVDKFGWCTWNAFYLTVEPIGIWYGVKNIVEGGIRLRFLIIDDGWQNIRMDGETPVEDAKDLILGGTRAIARLHNFEECNKFKKYEAGTLLRTNAPPFGRNRPKMVSTALELDLEEMALRRAIESGATNLSGFKCRIEKLRRELNDLYSAEEVGVSSVGNESNTNSESVSEDKGLKAFTKDLRVRFKELDDIYVWQALCGSWGGTTPGTTHLNSKVIPVEVSPGLEGTMHDSAVMTITKGGIGLVHPDQAIDFYHSMHSYLCKAGITGAKVDTIHTLEYLCEEYGGRVELAKRYYEGLTESLVKNFNGNGLISSMQQCNDFFFLGTWQIAFGRVCDDFWFHDPNGDPAGMYWLQGVHMVHCAYNSLWMSQMIHPDWDMFRTDHPCAEYHAGARAICGGPVCVSDLVGCNNLDLLKQLVFPDGTIPKCLHFALPTRDCLFKNPLFDGKTILKIWNLNKFGGVIGAFNCQGGGWVPKERRFKGLPHVYKPVSGAVHVKDVEWDQKKETSHMSEAEEYAVHLNQADELITMTPDSDAIQFSLEPSSFEIFEFVPMKKLEDRAKFAAFGLSNMFNSGGTVAAMEYDEGVGEVGVRMQVKGGGKLLVYSSEKPRKSWFNGVEAVFEWSDEGKLTMDVPWVEEKGGVSDVGFVY